MSVLGNNHHCASQRIVYSVHVQFFFCHISFTIVFPFGNLHYYNYYNYYKYSSTMPRYSGGEQN